MREWGDFVWAYLGPAGHEPALPELEFALLPPAHRYVSKKLQQCNWAQACEGAPDTAHFSFLHMPVWAGTTRSTRPCAAPPKMAHVWHWSFPMLDEGQAAIDRIGEFVRTQMTFRHPRRARASAGPPRPFLRTGGLLPRAAQAAVEQACRTAPVVVLLGARQTGKTTLVRSMPLLADRPYLTLDDFDLRTQASADPESVGRGPGASARAVRTSRTSC